MSASAPPTAVPSPPGTAAGAQRVAFLGPPQWLESSCPPERRPGSRAIQLPLIEGSDVERAIDAAQRFAPRVTVVFDPAALPATTLRRLPGTTLGVIVGDARGPGLAEAVAALDRTLSFRPGLTGTTVGGGRLWRAIPPPVADLLFGDVRPLHRRPAAMAIGRATAHREAILTPAKHHHDVLHLVHGIGGEPLAALLRDYDAGIYVAAEPGRGFGQQVGIHLAAGQLLLADVLEPGHGLEPGIDYVRVDSADGLVWALDRLARFPEMHQRIRLRGRMKAEQFRASHVFDRVIHDLLADVAAFGAHRG